MKALILQIWLSNLCLSLRRCLFFLLLFYFLLETNFFNCILRFYLFNNHSKCDSSTVAVSLHFLQCNDKRRRLSSKIFLTYLKFVDCFLADRMYVVIVTSVFTGLALYVVALRLYTRFYLVKAPGLDDLIIFCALVCTSICFVYHEYILSDEVSMWGVRAQS